MMTFKKLLFAITSISLIASQATAIPFLSIQDSEKSLLMAYAGISFGTGFVMNFISHNTKEQKIPSNIAGVAITAYINKATSIRDTLSSRKFDFGLRCMELPGAGLLVGSEINNNLAHALVATAAYGAGAATGIVTRICFDNLCWACSTAVDIVHHASTSREK